MTKTPTRSQLSHTVEKINKVAASGEDDFQTLFLKIAKFDPRRDFRGQDLSGVDFGDVDLAEFDFTESNLESADFTRVKNVDYANFSRATLRGVSWPDSSQRKEFLKNLRIPKSYNEALSFWMKQAADTKLRRYKVNKTSASSFLVSVGAQEPLVYSFLPRGRVELEATKYVYVPPRVRIGARSILRVYTPADALDFQVNLRVPISIRDVAIRSIGKLRYKFSASDVFRAALLAGLVRQGVVTAKESELRRLQDDLFELERILIEEEEAQLRLNIV